VVKDSGTAMIMQGQIGDRVVRLGPSFDEHSYARRSPAKHPEHALCVSIESHVHGTRTRV